MAILAARVQVRQSIAALCDEAMSPNDSLRTMPLRTWERRKRAIRRDGMA